MSYKKKEIAILMACHNRKEKTIRCLSKLSEQILNENLNITIFLVDDNSTDGTKEFVEKKFPEIHLINGNGSLYWNGGMRLAWETASNFHSSKFDYYLWLNDDTELINNAINQLVSISEKLEAKSIVVGATVSFDNHQTFTYGGRSCDKGFKLITPNETVKECHTFNGNCVLIPSGIFESIGNLDKYFRHSFGDIEYGLRAKKAGYKCYIAPSFVGFCNRNQGVPKYLSAKYSIFKRLQYLYSPLGFNPFEAFYLNRKYNSLIYSILLFIKIHANSILPSLFNKNNYK